MGNVPQTDADHNREDPYIGDRKGRTLADDPVIRKIIARVADVEARQARIELRQTDMEQGLTLMHGLVVQMHDRQEHLLAQTNFIVEWIKASGFTGAL